MEPIELACLPIAAIWIASGISGIVEDPLYHSGLADRFLKPISHMDHTSQRIELPLTD